MTSWLAHSMYVHWCMAPFATLIACCSVCAAATAVMPWNMLFLVQLGFALNCHRVQVAFIRTRKLGFDMLEAGEFGELQSLLAKVEFACGNRDFGLALQQGFVPGAFFKVLPLLWVTMAALGLLSMTCGLQLAICPQHMSCSASCPIFVAFCWRFRERGERLMQAPDILWLSIQVDFERVPDLVAQRKVLLRKGTAYVSRHETASLVVRLCSGSTLGMMSFAAMRLWAAQAHDALQVSHLQSLQHAVA